MICDGVVNGKYTETNDNSLKELLLFQGFPHRDFYNHELYKDMKPDNNQPACVYGIAKPTSLNIQKKLVCQILKLHLSLFKLEHLCKILILDY